MPFEHRYLWSTRFVRQRLRSESLSESITFRYFLAIMAFDWLQFTLIATTPTPRISQWSVANSWLTFAVTVLGLVYLYRRNGGASGKQFLRRYFPLSVTVGWKFLVVMFAFLSFIPLLLAGHSKELLGWSTTLTLAFINIVMFWRIGFHLHSLSYEPGA